MSEEGERDWRDPEDRWCVECHRNVFPQKAGGPLIIAVSSVLLLVLGGVTGLTIAGLITFDARPGIFTGAFVGLVIAVLIVAAEPRRCPICKSKNLKDPRWGN
jgi:hypothetical protein